MKKMNKKGFTLIEMLVVIAIIAILVAIIIPTVSNATEKAKQATDVANIRSYVAQYQIDNMNGVTGSASKAYQELSKPYVPKAANGTFTFTTTKVTYVATLLTDGNGANNKTYEWALGDLVTESTSAPTTTPTTPSTP